MLTIVLCCLPLFFFLSFQILIHQSVEVVEKINRLYSTVWGLMKVHNRQKQIEYKQGNQMDLVATFAKTAVLFEVLNTQHVYLPALWDLQFFEVYAQKVFRI